MSQDAIFNILKPPGMTSHDVVDWVRSLTGQRRVGHAGTLDPAATGVLVVMTGRLTRLSRYISAYDKRYRFELTFGIATDSGDADGEVVEEVDASALTAADVEAAIDGLSGILHMPPHRYSAAKVQGRKAYEAARDGQQLPLQPRPVVIHHLRLVRFVAGRHPTALLDVHCGKGTYVRSLAELIGKRAGTYAHASFVLRTHVGPLAVDQAYTLEELRTLAERDGLASADVGVAAALAGYAAVHVTHEQARMLAHGNPVPLAERHAAGEVLVAYDEAGTLVAVGEARGGMPQVLQPRTVVVGGQ